MEHACSLMLAWMHKGRPTQQKMLVVRAARNPKSVAASTPSCHLSFPESKAGNHLQLPTIATPPTPTPATQIAELELSPNSSIILYAVFCTEQFHPATTIHYCNMMWIPSLLGSNLLD